MYLWKWTILGTVKTRLRITLVGTIAFRLFCTTEMWLAKKWPVTDELKRIFLGYAGDWSVRFAETRTLNSYGRPFTTDVTIGNNCEALKDAERGSKSSIDSYLFAWCISTSPRLTLWGHQICNSTKSIKGFSYSRQYRWPAHGQECTEKLMGNFKPYMQ